MGKPSVRKQLTFGRFEERKFPKSSSPTTWGFSQAELNGSLRFLNTPNTRGQDRVLAILEQMQDLAKIEPPIFNEKIAGTSMVGNSPNPAFEKVAPEKKYKLHLEIERRKDALNTELAQYRFTPYVSTGPGKNRLVVTWHRDWRNEIEPRKPPDKLIEGQTLELVLNLARSGRVDRLRRCAHCNNWLYARFQHQHFCSTKCQQRQYTHTDAFRKHRREYMREYYQNSLSGGTRNKSDRTSRRKRRR